MPSPRDPQPWHDHQQCDVNYFEIRRAVGPSSVWSYEFHRIIDGRMSSPEAMRPYEMLPIPADLEIIHITLLVEGPAMAERTGAMCEYASAGVSAWSEGGGVD